MAQGNVDGIRCDETQRPHHKRLIDKVHAAGIPASSSSADETRWRAVLSRAPTSDFLYAVISTRIFCRTSCPSRRPRRANVIFFDSIPDAAAAGFRPCRRCRPEAADGTTVSPPTPEELVRIACEYVRERKGVVQLLDLSRYVGLSPRYFHGLFKQFVGQTPGAYSASVRQECAQKNDKPISPSTTSTTETSSAADLPQPAPQHHNIPVPVSVGTSHSHLSSAPDLAVAGPALEQSQPQEWVNSSHLNVPSYPGFDPSLPETWPDDELSGYIDPLLL
ncbi:hypothetical protein F5Y17DRAFT_92646 [Xylariaceae sp. FL0594]|nr:hypothetical protein F5Y17DRAFT_92646 [Xylariaceae sp. FL0594]